MGDLRPTAGKIVFGINETLRDWSTNREKNLDLVLARPADSPWNRNREQYTFEQLAKRWHVVLTDDQREVLESLPRVEEGEIGALLMALEAKATMTAHVRALPRLFDELTSSHATVHGASNNALSVGLAMVNLADEFVSSDLNKKLGPNGTPTDGTAGSGVGNSNVANVAELNKFDGLVLRSNVEPVRIVGITDGASNTLLIAEKWLHPQRIASSGDTGADGGDNEIWVNAGWDECVVRVGGGTYNYSYTPGGQCGPGTTTRTVPRTPQPDIDAPCTTNGAGGRVTIWNQQFGSSHIGGINAVFGDGSVRTVRYNIDPVVWAATCTRNGGEVVTLD